MVEWLLVALLCAAIPGASSAPPAGVLSFAFAPDAPPRMIVSASGLVFSADGATLYGIGDAQMVSWDAATGSELHRQELAGARSICRTGADVCIVVSDPAPAAGSLVNAASGARLGSIVIPAEALAASAGGKARPPSYLAPNQPAYIGPLAVTAGSGWAACIADGSSTLLEDAALSDRVLLFEAVTGKLLCNLPVPKDPLGTGPRELRGLYTRTNVRDFVFSPDGKQLAAVSDSGVVVIWSCPAGKVLAVLPGQPPHWFSWQTPLARDGMPPSAARFLDWLGAGAVVTQAPRADLDVPGVRRLVRWSLAEAAPDVIEWRGAAPRRSLAEQASVAQHSVVDAGQGVLQASFVVCTPDGRSAFVALDQAANAGVRGQRPGLEVVDLSARRAVGLLCVEPNDWISVIACSPDASRVALATRLGTIIIADRARLEELAREQQQSGAHCQPIAGGD